MEEESQQDQDQEQGETKEDFKEQLNIKIEKYFESKQYLESRDELNNFLSEIDLLEVWDSDEEKDTLWQFIFKYNKDSRIDCEGAKKGIKRKDLKIPFLFPPFILLLNLFSSFDAMFNNSGSKFKEEQALSAYLPMLIIFNFFNFFLSDDFVPFVSCELIPYLLSSIIS